MCLLQIFSPAFYFNNDAAIGVSRGNGAMIPNVLALTVIQKDEALMAGEVSSTFYGSKVYVYKMLYDI